MRHICQSEKRAFDSRPLFFAVAVTYTAWIALECYFAIVGSWSKVFFSWCESNGVRLPVDWASITQWEHGIRLGTLIPGAVILGCLWRFVSDGNQICSAVHVRIIFWGVVAWFVFAFVIMVATIIVSFNVIGILGGPTTGNQRAHQIMFWFVCKAVVFDVLAVCTFVNLYRLIRGSLKENDSWDNLRPRSGTLLIVLGAISTLVLRGGDLSYFVLGLSSMTFGLYLLCIRES